LPPSDDFPPERRANGSIHRKDLTVDGLEIDATALQVFELVLELAIQVTFPGLASSMR